MGKSANGKELGKAVYQRPNGTYEARYVDRFGKSRSVYGKTKNEVLKKQRLGIVEDIRQLNVIDSKMTLDEWYDKWIHICKKNCRDTTIRTYEIQYERLRASLGWRRLTNLNLVILQAAFNDLESDQSRKKCKALLVDILNRAVEADLLVKNPALGINPVIDKKERPEKRILNKDETKLLLKYAEGGMMYSFLVVALGTGMRLGEILGLTWDCIDFENRFILVNKTLTYLPGDGVKANYEFHKPKTPAGKRKIPMTPKVYEVLIQQRKFKDKVSGRFSPREGFEDLVFISKTNQPLNAGNIKCTINYITDKINRELPEQHFKHLTPHGLRHTFATNCIENGMSPKVLQKIMGHTSLQMTMDLYCHVRETTMAAEMEKMAVFMS